MSTGNNTLSYHSAANTPPAKIGTTPGIPLDFSIPKMQMLGAILIVLISALVGCTVAGWLFGSTLLTALSVGNALAGGLCGASKISPAAFSLGRLRARVATKIIAFAIMPIFFAKLPAAFACFVVAWLSSATFVSIVFSRTSP